MPNLQIVDYSYGFTGSAHDSAAWMGTRVAKDPASLLEPGEFIWADSAYTVGISLMPVSL